MRLGIIWAPAWRFAMEADGWERWALPSRSRAGATLPAAVVQLPSVRTAVEPTDEAHGSVVSGTNSGIPPILGYLKSRHTVFELDKKNSTVPALLRLQS